MADVEPQNAPPEDDGQYTPLEDQTQDAPPPPPQAAAVPVATPHEPAEPPTIAGVDDEDDIDAHAVEDRITRERMVPLRVAAELREKRRSEKQERDTLSGRVAELESQAQQAVEAARQWQAYAQQVAAQAQAVQPQPDPEPHADPRRQQQDDARLVRAERIAKRNDWYKGDGTLDVQRGLEELAEREDDARQIAAREITPLKQQQAVERARMNTAFIASKIQKVGAQVDPAVMNLLQQNLGPELMQETNVAMVSHAAALGWPILTAILREDPAALDAAVSALRKQAKAAPVAEPPKAPPPVVTEPIRAAAPRPPQLSGMAAKTARQMGLTDRQVEERYGNPKAVYVIADDVDKD